MMICALLYYLGMFPTVEESIKHYNVTRSVNAKAITISSQKRYVKFFEGFLNLHLIDRQVEKPPYNFFEQTLKNYNSLRVHTNKLLQLNKQPMWFFTMVLGPFTTTQANNLNITISILNHKDQAEFRELVDFKLWEEENPDLNDKLGNPFQARQWYSSASDKHYLTLNLKKLPFFATGDFKIEVKPAPVKFYFTLNVSAIRWNEDLKKLQPEIPEDMQNNRLLQPNHVENPTSLHLKYITEFDDHPAFYDEDDSKSYELIYPYNAYESKHYELLQKIGRGER